jgi:signal recognition particle subunit SRP54
MQDAFKAMSKNGGKGFARMAQMFGGGMPGGMGGGMPPGVSHADLEKAQQMLAENGGSLPGLGKPGGLPGLPNFPFKKP